MRFEMGGVDHDPLGLACLACELGKDLVEHTQAAPSNEAVVDRLVWPLTLGRIAPHQAVLDGVNDSGNNPPIINPGYPVQQRKKWLDPAYLRLAQQKRHVHRQRLLAVAIESTSQKLYKYFNKL